MIAALKREIRARLAHRKLERLTAKRRAEFAAAHPDYATRRKAALRHQPREWAQ
jgi:hypothetical protein